MEELFNRWEAIDNLIEIQQLFNELIESKLLKRCINDLLYTTTTVLDMLDPTVMNRLDML